MVSNTFIYPDGVTRKRLPGNGYYPPPGSGLPIRLINTRYGVLNASGNATSDAAAGIGHAMFEIKMRDANPSAGTFTQSAVDTLAAQMALYQSAGMKITLGLGLHYPAAYMQVDAMKFTDQSGNKSTSAVDYVWTQQARDIAEAYMDFINQTIPFSSLWAIRATSGARSEVLYPNANTGGYTYWDYGPAPVSGTNLATGQTLNPIPVAANRGTAGNAARANFYDWHIQSLANTVEWQRDAAVSRGFGGYVETVCPGQGAFPATVTSDINTTLPGSAVSAVGASWDRLFAKLAAMPNPQQFVAYCSSAPDGSGGDVGPQLTDVSTPLSSSTVSSWSAARWICRIANQYGMLYRQENPGYFAGDKNSASYVDTSSNGMMAKVRAMLASGLVDMHYWSHDGSLHDPSLVSPSGLFPYYSSMISYYNNNAGPATAPTPTLS